MTPTPTQGTSTNTAGNADDNSGENLNNGIMRVAVKLPPFWRTAPEIWFAQAEAQFFNAKITADETKFYTVVGSIEGDILTQVSDVVLKPPTSDKYETLKKRLLETFGDSDQKKLKTLLSDIELGGRTPTQLLNEMTKLANDKAGDDILKTLWIKCLPVQVRAILSTVSGDLKVLAPMADKIMEVSDFGNNVLAISKNKSDSDEKIDRLEKQIEELTKAVGRLSQNHSRNRSRNRSSTPAGNSNSGNFNENKLCWYHKKFAEKASRCITPCNFGNSKN